MKNSHLVHDADVKDIKITNIIITKNDSSFIEILKSQANDIFKQS